MKTRIQKGEISKDSKSKIRRRPNKTIIKNKKITL